jgi:hypothetical protein
MAKLLKEDKLLAPITKLYAHRKYIITEKISNRFMTRRLLNLAQRISGGSRNMHYLLSDIKARGNALVLHFPHIS